MDFGPARLHSSNFEPPNPRIGLIDSVSRSPRARRDLVWYANSGRYGPVVDRAGHQNTIVASLPPTGESMPIDSLISTALGIPHPLDSVSAENAVIRTDARIRPCMQGTRSIRIANGLQAVATGFSLEILLGETVEGILEREPTVDVVHVVIDDKVMQLLRLAGRRRQRQHQHPAEPEFRRRRRACDARIACIH